MVDLIEVAAVSMAITHIWTCTEIWGISLRIQKLRILLNHPWLLGKNDA